MVSGTFQSTKKNDSAAKIAYIRYGMDAPNVSSSGGNEIVMRKFAIHCAAAATPSAAARMRLGNISPSSTQTSGPHVAPKNTTNRLAAIRAIDAPASPVERHRRVAGRDPTTA